MSRLRAVCLLTLLVLLTGMTTAAGATVSMNITNTSDGSIARFDFDRVIFTGNTTDIHVELLNTGSTPVSTNFTLNIHDEQDRRLYRYFDGPEEIDPGETRHETVSHTAPNNGTYILRLEAVVGDSRLRTARFLEVVDFPEPGEADPIQIIQYEVEWIYPPEPEPPEILSRSWNISYPSQLNVSQGGSVSLPITVTSTGEGPVRNVIMSLDTPPDLEVSYDPPIIFSIDPGESQTFAVQLQVANDTIEDQDVQFSLESERLRTQGTTAIRVYPKLTVRQLQQEVSSLSRMHSELQGEIQAANESGLNMSEPTRLAEQAREDLHQASASLETADIDAARNKIEDARSNIGSSYSALYTERQRHIRLHGRSIDTRIVMGILAVLVAALMVLMYVYYSREARKKPALLRESEET